MAGRITWQRADLLSWDPGPVPRPGDPALFRTAAEVAATLSPARWDIAVAAAAAREATMEGRVMTVTDTVLRAVRRP